MVGVTGSIPVPPTIFFHRSSAFRVARKTPVCPGGCGPLACLRGDFPAARGRAPANPSLESLQPRIPATCRLSNSAARREPPARPSKRFGAGYSGNMANRSEKTDPRSHESPVVVDAGPGFRRGPGDEPPPPGRWLSWKRRQAASSHLIIRFQRDATSCKAAGSGVSLLPLLALSRHVKAMGGPNASAAFERQHL